MIWLLISLAIARPQPWLPDDNATFEEAVPGAISEAPWWVDMGDSTLVDLVDRGLSENGDVTAAYHRVTQADAIAWQQASPFLPQQSIRSPRSRASPIIVTYHTTQMHQNNNMRQPA